MISRSKSRPTHIDGTRFRFSVSSTPKSEGVFELNITIQSEDHNGRKLFVKGITQHDYAKKPPQCLEDQKYHPTIIRADIDGFIKEAIAEGWDYETPGTDFVIQMTNEPFRMIAYGEEFPADWYRARHFGRAKI